MSSQMLLPRWWNKGHHTGVERESPTTPIRNLQLLMIEKLHARIATSPSHVPPISDNEHIDPCSQLHYTHKVVCQPPLLSPARTPCQRLP